ncbi:hypothetical protein LI177_02955 [bacterium 210820-DFI.6.37]|nr:hypothetical protein [bacterium 210820-DFI.6.37]
MKLTNDKIINFLNLEISKKRLPIRLAYAISVNAAAIAPAVEAYNKQRKELLEKYAEKDEDGNLVARDGQYKIVDPEGWNRDIMELLSAEAEVNISSVPVEVLEKCDEPQFYNLSIDELNAINFMIE